MPAQAVAPGHGTAAGTDAPLPAELPGGPATRLHAPTSSDREAQTRRARRAAAALAAGLAASLIWLMAAAHWPVGEAPDTSAPLPFVLLALFGVNTLWIAWAAAIAILGAARIQASARRGRPSTQALAYVPDQRRDHATTPMRTAILITLCGEAPGPIAAAAAVLRRDLDAAVPCNGGTDTTFDIFLLSDTADPRAVTQEEAALASLAGLPGIHYRRRTTRTGRKPGNIADWVRGWGAAYQAMAILDADSRMTADCLRRLVARLHGDPALGLVQAGMRLVPAASRFGALQRLSARLCGPVVIAGLSGWSGHRGNFWGHNAVIRIVAFAEAAGLPRLPGRAPFGGEILSHDFIEAAWLARAGWGVAIEPDSRGSFEDGPQTLAAFHRRDRRWCQGNLQHIRLLIGARMAGASRVHLLSGVQSYLSAPIWLALVVLAALVGPGQPGLAAAALAGALALLMVPKLAGAVALLRRNPRLRRRPGLILRAVVSETVLSTLLAPLVLVHQSASVLAVLAGRDCGWTPAAARPTMARALARLPIGAPEAAAGAALIAGALALGPGMVAAAWLVPLAGPLLAAPVLIRWLDAPRPARRQRPAPARRMSPSARPGVCQTHSPSDQGGATARPAAPRPARPARRAA